MSFAQVIAELTALTRPQRREVALRLFEMEATAAEASDIAVCEHSAAMGFALLDAMEAEEAAKGMQVKSGKWTAMGEYFELGCVVRRAPPQFPQPGTRAAFKVIVVLDTGNEAGSAAMTVERPGGGLKFKI